MSTSFEQIFKKYRPGPDSRSRWSLISLHEAKPGSYQFCNEFFKPSKKRPKGRVYTKRKFQNLNSGNTEIHVYFFIIKIVIIGTVEKKIWSAIKGGWWVSAAFEKFENFVKFENGWLPKEGLADLLENLIQKNNYFQ